MAAGVKCGGFVVRFCDWVFRIWACLCSVRKAGEGAEAPECGGDGQDDEGDTDQAARRGALAPALEHGDESNDEEEDCDDTKALEPHGLFSSIAMSLPP